jgi:sterol desaturase/sphingolipid hydroxylase (fatty acid hydroxylase superfamily)
MVSLRALRAYIIVNSFLTTLASFQHALHSISIPVAFTSFLLRNFILLLFVEVLTDKKSLLVPSVLSLQSSTKTKFIEIVQASFIEYITYLCILSAQPSQNTKMYVEILYFIPLSFIFEIVFDFFHYWTHRICHLHPWLYKRTHKKHHEHSVVSPHTTYHQHYLDIILTNSIPFLLTYVLFPFQLSLWQLHMILVYKEFVEISGHCRRILYPASSFPQFIWLPRMLSISLYAEDHHIHHTRRMYNFGKRFSLWDKIFNTYLCGVSKKEKHL